MSWDTTAVGDGNYVLTATATDTASQTTTSAAVAVTVSNGGGGGSEPMSAAVVGSTTAAKGGNWTATATTTVTSADGPLGGAVVTGTWNGGSAGTCTTGTDGICSLSKNMNKRVNSVEFQVTGVTKDGYIWDGTPASVIITK